MRSGGAPQAARRPRTLRWLPSTRATAERLGFVTLPQMVRSLVRAVEQPVRGVRVIEVPEIRGG